MARRAAADFEIRPVVSSFPKRLKPPSTLSEGARAEFLRIVMAEKPDHFTKSDLSMLCQFSEAAALAELAIKEALRESPPNGRWMAAWREATRTMKDLALRLRLSPQSRQHNNPKRPTPANYYEQMKLEEEQDEGG
jgi:phage terminase small subunit